MPSCENCSADDRQADSRQSKWSATSVPLRSIVGSCRWQQAGGAVGSTHGCRARRAATSVRGPVWRRDQRYCSHHGRLDRVCRWDPHMPANRRSSHPHVSSCSRANKLCACMHPSWTSRQLRSNEEAPVRTMRTDESRSQQGLWRESSPASESAVRRLTALLPAECVEVEDAHVQRVPLLEGARNARCSPSSNLDDPPAHHAWGRGTGPVKRRSPRRAAGRAPVLAGGGQLVQPECAERDVGPVAGRRGRDPVGPAFAARP